MERAADLIDHVKASKNLSYRQIAKHIGVDAQRVNHFRSEYRFPTTKHIIKLCELAPDQDPAYWVFMLSARKAKTAREAAIYEKAAKNYA